MERDKQPNCHKCQYLKRTYRVELPYQCQQFAMSSSVIPSLYVWKTSGEQCKYWKDIPSRPMTR